jgi:phosphoglycolate phosphatase
LARPSRLSLLIFDLDGTLIDSRADLVASVNLALTALGRPALPDDVVGGYVGDGAAVLMQRALGLAPPPHPARTPPPPVALAPEASALAGRALDLFLEFYAAHKLDRTQLYPGVHEGLRALHAAGARLAVLTNKPVVPSRQIVAHLGIAPLFEEVLGGNSFAQKKPDPVGIHALLERCQVAPRQAVMIGDSGVDVRCGRNAGVWTAGVSYGFAPESLRAQPPDWMADSFPQLGRDLLAAMPE